jgi:outer membrane receptor protein involved in Fe transport
MGVDLQQAGLRNDNQSSNSLFSRNFTNLLPNAQYSYNFSGNRSLRINYRAHINPPSVSQLQPVADNTNPLNIRLGNPDLKPEYINTLTAMYNSFQEATFRSVFAVLNVSQTTHKIVNASSFDNLGSQITQPINRNGNYTASGFVVFGRPLRTQFYG